MTNVYNPDKDWREPARLVPADFRGLLAFRQFKINTQGDFHPDYFPAANFRPYQEDFSLRSIFQEENWRPTGNVAHCNANSHPHPIPSLNCPCGYYASYSSTIIYQPGLLGNRLYCFAAIRMYGENLPLAQNGLRSSGADVDGILFHPSSADVPQVVRMIPRLVREGIFFTFSAREFIKRFPDQPYKDILGFDPVERLSARRHKFSERRAASSPAMWPYPWQLEYYTQRFCRPLSAEMIQRNDLPAESTATLTIFEAYLKPEYRPGGSLYKHPLLEIWDN